MMIKQKQSNDMRLYQHEFSAFDPFDLIGKCQPLRHKMSKMRERKGAAKDANHVIILNATPT
jgi:hypothetical protein